MLHPAERALGMGNNSTKEINISDLPEGCITNVISFTTPQDACVSALVSKLFSAAANSDLVWERFVPGDYNDILLSRSVPPLKSSDFSSKKELFVYLCRNPVLLDRGTKSLNLDKITGKKCVSLGAKVLDITWCGTPQYWKWGALSGSRFEEVAELIDVCQLEMTARIHSQLLSTKTTYGVYLVVNHGEEAYLVEEPPIDVYATFVGEGGYRSGFRSDYLETSSEQRYRRHNHGPSPVLKVDTSPSMGEDGWMEIEIGEFYNDDGEDSELQMFLRKNGAWKRALIVEGVQFRPKSINGI